MTTSEEKKAERAILAAQEWHEHAPQEVQEEKIMQEQKTVFYFIVDVTASMNPYHEGTRTALNDTFATLSADVMICIVLVRDIGLKDGALQHEPGHLQTLAPTTCRTTINAFLDANLKAEGGHDFPEDFASGWDVAIGQAEALEASAPGQFRHEFLTITDAATHGWAPDGMADKFHFFESRCTFQYGQERTLKKLCVRIKKLGGMFMFMYANAHDTAKTRAELKRLLEDNYQDTALMSDTSSQTLPSYSASVPHIYDNTDCKYRGLPVESDDEGEHTRSCARRPPSESDDEGEPTRGSARGDSGLPNIYLSAVRSTSDAVCNYLRTRSDRAPPG